MRLTLSLLATLLFATASWAQLPPCDVVLSSTPITCPGLPTGSLTVNTVSGGPYTYAWVHDAALQTNAAIGLGAGQYTVTVSGPGCETVFDTVLLDPPQTPLGSLAYTNMDCAGVNNATVTLTLNGNYSFIWFH
ncbi:MAG TPA: hypothetical protein PK760_14445, partial [Flavobacteriales bacterium]|nr:hypothetical protein [Flavobacteriales bacterium]